MFFPYQLDLTLQSTRKKYLILTFALPGVLGGGPPPGALPVVGQAALAVTPLGAVLAQAHHTTLLH